MKSIVSTKPGNMVTFGPRQSGDYWNSYLFELQIKADYIDYLTNLHKDDKPEPPPAPIT